MRVLSMQNRPRVILAFFDEMAEETVIRLQRKHPRMGPRKILEKIREKANSCCLSFVVCICFV